MNNIIIEIPLKIGFIIEHAMKIYQKTTLFNKQTKMFTQDIIIGTTLCTWNKSVVKDHWTHPPPNWYKQNMDVSKMERTKSTTMSYVYRDSNGNIFQWIGKTIGDCRPCCEDFGDGWLLELSMNLDNIHSGK